MVDIAPSQTLSASSIVKFITKESKPITESHVERDRTNC